MKTAKSVASEVLAISFLHYPLMKHAFEGYTDEKRADLLRKLYNRCVAATEMYGGILNTPDEQGSLIWLRGENFTLPLIHEIRSGMAFIPFEVGIKQTLRLMNHDGVAEGWVRKNACSSMGYIWCVGVLAEARGKGYSRLLIDKSIAQMQSEGMTECWLKTEDPKNVSIYQKLGFEVKNEMVVKSSGLTSWAFMKQI